MPSPLNRWEKYRVKASAKPRLRDEDASATDLCADKKSARENLKRYRKEIDKLAAALAAENQRALLVILQGVDASGKDGAVKRVFTGVNPQHCKVVSFKEPDREELEHDYLWRVYRALPAHGDVGVFNRSQYEDVVARQARSEISVQEARQRLEQIAAAERTWTANGMTIRKFFLHISKSEQKTRFKARLDTPEKHWKVQPSDFADRRRWPKFQAAYEEVLSRTSTRQAPWYIIPADYKWYRDVAIAGVVLAALRAMRPQYPRPELHRKALKLD